MFVHLDCHSHYSFLRAVPSPQEIIAAAVEASMPAVALTDTNGMYAAIPFYKEALAHGIKPIVGAKLDIDRELSPIRSQHSSSVSSHHSPLAARHFTPTVLLAENAEGYSNLCRLTTLRQMGTVAPSPKTADVENEGHPVTLSDLAQYSRGVIALGALTKRSSGDVDSDKDSPGCAYSANIGYIGSLKEIFGERFYLAVQRLSPGDGRLLREAERIGRDLNIPLVATNNVHFLKPEDHLHHRAMNAIRVGGLLTTVATLSQDPSKVEITAGEAW